VAKFFIETMVPRVTHQSGTKHSKFGSYKTKPLKDWEEELKQQFSKYKPEVAYSGPLMVHITIVWPYLISDVNTKAKCEELKQCPYIWHESTPDWDNATKTIGDMLGSKHGVGIIDDDSIIVYGLVRKCRGETPGILVNITQIKGKPHGVLSDIQECINEGKEC